MLAAGLVRRARTVASLPLRDQLLLVRVVLTAAIVEVGIRLVSLPALARLLGVSVIDRPGGAAAPAAARRPSPEERRVLVLTARVFRRWPGACLRKSLTRAALLASLEPVVRIGVRRSEAGIEAHAWLEIDGAVVEEDPEASGFAPLRAAP